jgi:hypothetical protein
MSENAKPTTMLKAVQVQVNEFRGNLAPSHSTALNRRSAGPQPERSNRQGRSRF